MSTGLILLLTLLALCGVALLYLIFWVGPRINKMYRLARQVNDTVFAKGSDWQKKHHLCGRAQRDGYEYAFGPIRLETFYTKEEIALLYS